MIAARTLLSAILSTTLLAATVLSAAAAEPYPDASGAIGIPPESILVLRPGATFYNKETYSRSEYDGKRAKCRVVFRDHNDDHRTYVAASSGLTLRISGTAQHDGRTIVEFAESELIRAIECSNPFSVSRYFGSLYDGLMEIPRQAAMYPYTGTPSQPYTPSEPHEDVSAGELRAAFNWDFWIALPEKTAQP